MLVLTLIGKDRDSGYLKLPPLSVTWTLGTSTIYLDPRY